MDDQSITQVELAKRMGCTQQYVSNLLKGSSNMTLETIARLENALSIDLVKSSDSAGEKLDPDIKTSDFVEGYKHRKNAK